MFLWVMTLYGLVGGCVCQYLNTEDGAERSSEELINHLTNHTIKPESFRYEQEYHWNYTLSEKIWKKLLNKKRWFLNAIQGNNYIPP
jgi:hypothetical protein